MITTLAKIILQAVSLIFSPREATQRDICCALKLPMWFCLSAYYVCYTMHRNWTTEYRAGRDWHGEWV